LLTCDRQPIRLARSSV